MPQTLHHPRPSRRPKAKRSLPFWGRLLVLASLVGVGFPIGWVVVYRFIEAPGTVLMAERALAGDPVTRRPVGLDQISPNLVRAVIAAEDARFCAHTGFDVEAIEEALAFNERAKAEGSSRRRGASTISQQTAKNLFLWPDRSWVRKGLEAYFTVLIELLWPKERIIEAYLNAVEWGGGAFGAEAAARVHFQKSAADLTAREAARLAAVLPNPRAWDAGAPGPYVRNRARTLQGRMRNIEAEGLDDCIFGRDGP